MNNDTILYTSPPLSEYELRKRAKLAGYAHIDRIAVDGGPLHKPRPIRRRFVQNVAGWGCAAISAIVLVILLWGIL